MLTRRVLRPLPQMPAMREIERDHSLARVGLFLCFCLSAVAFSMAVAKLPVRELVAIPQLQSLGNLTHALSGSTPAASASPRPVTAPSSIVLASPSLAAAGQASVITASSAAVPQPPASAAAPSDTPSAAPSIAASPAPSSVAPSPASAPASPKSSAPASPRPSVSAKVSYTVQAGDTLFAIAKRNGVSIEALSAANGISAGATLKVGQKLEISA
ncbi:MAG: LysM peptidoglycan-binding domain-containing protein [Chloroflexi bacterium]|nr:LysM peptidoglycan-binding domain-containing protein [Chloroflexota bacterium]